MWSINNIAITNYIPSLIVNKIRSQIEIDVHSALNDGVIDAWFLPNHLQIVAEQTSILCQQHSEANKEIALLGAWLHDSSRLFGSTATHHLDSAIRARELLTKSDYPEEKIRQVEHICRSHQCESNQEVPITIEAKIVATADAMSHFLFSDFYDFIYAYYIEVGTDPLIAKQEVITKLNRDYQQKIYFPEIQQSIYNLYNNQVSKWT